VAAIPFFARLVEIALREVDSGLIEAAKSLGATRATIIRKVLVPEALPAIVLGLSTSVISLINYSAMAGIIGAGGIGDIAFRFGYQRFDDAYMITTIVLLVVIVQAIQSLGSWSAKRLSHR
jgi:D-methionine transport system permease protein